MADKRHQLFVNTGKRDFVKYEAFNLLSLNVSFGNILGTCDVSIPSGSPFIDASLSSFAQTDLLKGLAKVSVLQQRHTPSIHKKYLLEYPFSPTAAARKAVLVKSCLS